MNNALEIARRRKDKWVGDLIECLRIPSISTKPDFAPSVQECADWIVDHLKQMGIENVRTEKTSGHPMITGQHIVEPLRPTILVYGHYDVQPPEPLDLWTAPPFEPEIRDGKLFARGAVDDKGQLFMVLKAIQAYMESDDDLPVNLKFAIEGEEETGSENLPAFLAAHGEDLAADTLLVCDTTMMDSTTPTLTSGLRGLTYVQVDLRSAQGDLHSGTFGGAVVNVLHILAGVIEALHDEDNRVAIPGFYDDVEEVGGDIRSQVAALPFDMDSWRESSGNSMPLTETGYSIAEATAVRPCLDVNGVWGGYQSEGAKTVIPCEAHLKLSCRLVARQQPKDIYRKIESFITSIVPEGLEVRVTPIGFSSPFSANPDSLGMRAASVALEEVFGRPPVMYRGGGSIPAVAMFSDALGVEPTLMGFGLKSDCIHAPNEHFGLDRFDKGIESIIRFFHHFGGSQS